MEKRLSLVELKRKFPSLGVQGGRELLHDKERVPRGQERTPILRGYLTCFAVVLLTIGVFGRSSKLTRTQNQDAWWGDGFHHLS